MVEVCLKPENSTKAETWSSTFTSFNTETTSCLFVKKLTAACISTILYFRNIFPDIYFESKHFEGVSLKILKEGKRQSLTGRIQQWLDGAFEAIDKKSLKHLMLDIQDAKTNMTLEVYTMSFSYKQGNEALNFRLSTTQSNKSCGFTESNTKLSVINLLKTCSAVTRNSASLPSQFTLAMRLSYYEYTPEDYEPQGYMPWKPQDLVFPKQTRSIEIGVAETPLHYFKLINKSCLNMEFFKSTEDKKLSGSYQSLQQIYDTQECYGILQQQTMKNIKFYCHFCHQLDTRFKCHDKILTNLKRSSDQQKLAVFRKALKFCMKNYNSKITLRQMIKVAGSACQTRVAEIILKKMVEIEVAIPQTKRKAYLIDKNELGNKLAFYFYQIQNPQQI